MEKVAWLEAALANLTGQYEAAMEEKVKCQEAADKTAQVISVANRLVTGLASENIRWGGSVEALRQQERTLCGDVLLVASFISYLGGFTKQYRTEILERKWIPHVKKLKVSHHNLKLLFSHFKTSIMFMVNPKGHHPDVTGLCWSQHLFASDRRRDHRRLE